MSYSLEFQLSDRRSIIHNKESLKNIDILVDTGAFIPVWCSSFDLLRSLYSNIYFSGYITEISGFGQGKDYAPLYIIPEFVLSDGVSSVTYSNLPVAVIQKNLKFEMILSYTMFTTANMTFKNFISKQTGQIERIKPKLLLNFPNDELRVAANYGMAVGQQAKQAAQKYGAKGLVTNISIFSQK